MYNLKENEIRKNYLESVNKHIEKQSEICNLNRATLIEKGEEERRHELYNLLGKPLVDNYKKQVKLIKTEEVYSDQEKTATLYTFDIEGIRFSGWIIKKTGLSYTSKNKKALVIALHGGGGSPELATGIYINSSNYNKFATRVLTDETVVFVPQLLLWNCETFGNAYDREILNRRLVQQGGSITALEISLLMNCIDYFTSLDYIDSEKVGAVGLSYGGMYSLFLSASDKRIKSTYSSCWFSDRRVYNWHDWVYKNSENTFLDVEVCSLILPRKLILEVGKGDETFLYTCAQTEFDRLTNYANQKGVANSLTTVITEYAHEFDREDENINRFLQGLL